MSKARVALYGTVAVLALVATWRQNLQYSGGELFTRFWADTMENPASRSITVDILLLCIPLAVWMVLEARRLGIRFVWLYLLFGALVAISVTFPLFLIARERRLQDRQALATPDIVLLVLFSLGPLAFALASLLR